MGREFRLFEIFVVGIEAQYAIGAAAFHFHGVESRIAADVEHGFPRKVFRNHPAEPAPFHVGIIAEEMRWCCPHAIEVKVVKPGTERLHALADLVFRKGRVHDTSPSKARVEAAMVSDVVAARSLKRLLSPSDLLASRAIAVR